jgi:hypothetical protein
MMQPCKRDCPGRSPTCHAECEKYAAFTQQQAESYKKRLLDSDVKGAICDRQLRKKTFKMSL